MQKSATSSSFAVRKLGLRGATLALLGLLFSMAPAAQAQILAVHRQGSTVSDHVLGNNLWVSVSRARPNRFYQLALKDEMGTVVHSASVTTDASGVLPPYLLWHRSGVLGCDPNASIDPIQYRFRLFEDAETLAGRTFSIQLSDPLTTGGPVATKSLPLVASPAPRFYYSDGSGCPRFVFIGTEPIWVSAIHLPSGTPTTYIHWANTSPIDPVNPVDMRPLYPNGLSLTSPGTSPMMTEESQIPTPGNIDFDGQCIYGTIHPPLLGSSGGNETRFRTSSGFKSPGTTTTLTGTLPPLDRMPPVGHWPTDPNVNPAFACPPCVENQDTAP